MRTLRMTLTAATLGHQAWFPIQPGRQTSTPTSIARASGNRPILARPGPGRSTLVRVALGPTAQAALPSVGAALEVHRSSTRLVFAAPELASGGLSTMV